MIGAFVEDEDIDEDIAAEAEDVWKLATGSSESVTLAEMIIWGTSRLYKHWRTKICVGGINLWHDISNL